ncbi:hypothetical protein DUI87_20810 [Hirundo rustica rustica]|uniref:Uncharacterized protein n=1 Tax=Hirundo rustica rustica TaxID=333673 RepID=A0A3M0JPJ5_HIRRU|nr:hypothetical protein DUI87_20810 [Hirundo rustica rustica]
MLTLPEHCENVQTRHGVPALSPASPRYLIILSPKKHKMCRFQPAFHYSYQFIKYTWSKEQFWGLVHGIWPRLKRDRRRDGRSPFGPPGQLAKREQPGTGNEEERRRFKEMGQCTSKKKKTHRENNKVKSIPPGSPLEQLSAKWDSLETTRGLDQVKMVFYCTEDWPKLKLPGEWPWFGTHEEWMCYQSNQYLRTQEDPDVNQLAYAACWQKRAKSRENIKVCKLKEKESVKERKRKKKEKELIKDGTL